MGKKVMNEKLKEFVGKDVMLTVDKQELTGRLLRIENNLLFLDEESSGKKLIIQVEKVQKIQEAE